MEPQEKHIIEERDREGIRRTEFTEEGWSADDEVDIQDIPQTEQPSWFQRILLWAARHVKRWYKGQSQGRIRLIGAGTIIVGILLLLLVSNINFFSLPTLLSPSVSFTVQALPTWGTLTIDGQQIKHIPMPSQPPLHLSQGVHELVWKAAPFFPVHCTVFVPPVHTSGACPFTVTSTDATGRSAYVLQLPVSLATMPVPARTALITAIQAALDTKAAVETLQTGDHYAFVEETGKIYTASQPLLASERFLLETDLSQSVSCRAASPGNGCTLAGQDCRLLCTFPEWVTISATQPEWHVAALFYIQQHYQTSTGSIIANPAPESSGLTRAVNFVTLRIGWQQGRWSVTFHTRNESSFDDPLCLTTEISLLSNPTFTHPPTLGLPLLWDFASAPAAGISCTALGKSFTLQTGSLNEKAPSIVLFSHCNVLLRTTDEEADLWPQLPLASRHEQILLTQLMRRN